MDYMLVAGRKRHDEGRRMSEGIGMFEEAVAEVGLDVAGFHRAIATPGFLDDLRDDHLGAIARGYFGVPTIVMDGGVCFLALAPYPTGQKALEVFEAVRGFCKLQPVVREMKAPADEAEKQRQGEVFAVSRTAREYGRFPAVARV